MRRAWVIALVLGVVNSLLAVLAFQVVESNWPADYSYFTYMPPSDVPVYRPISGWNLVVLPLTLLVGNAVSVPLILRRSSRTASDH